MLSPLKRVWLAPLVPVLALAQESPVQSQMGATWWLVGVVAVAIASVVFWRMQTMKSRRGPHGAQSPTPRGP